MGTQPGRILYLPSFIGGSLMNLPSEVLGFSAGLDIEKRRHILWRSSSLWDVSLFIGSSYKVVKGNIIVICQFDCCPKW